MARKPSLGTETRVVNVVGVSPALIAALKLIQIPTDGILEVIERELVDNPALEGIDDTFGSSESERRIEDRTETPASDSDTSDYEMDEDYGEDDPEDYTADPDYDIDGLDSYKGEDYDYDGFQSDYMTRYIEDDPLSYKEVANSYHIDDNDRQVPISVEQTYHEYLTEQLEMLDLETAEQRVIAEHIIGMIDNQGYLTRDIDGIIRDIRFNHNLEVEKKEVVKILRMIQRFDPPGTGARDLRECLLIQLRMLAEASGIRSSERDQIAKAYIIIDEHFEEFKKKHYSRMQRVLGLKKEQDLEPYIKLICKLNPKPASGFATNDSSKSNYITPDFIITQDEDGQLLLNLHARNAPELRVSDAYQEQLRLIKEKKIAKNFTHADNEAYTFIKSKIDSARWFIDAIKQRQDTMMRTMQAILSHQYEYFKTGDTCKLRPMILKDIADATDLDISTISRVANSKFVQTEFGTKRIKDFFSESLQTEDGEEVSTHEVKEIMKEIISKEKHNKPLSDEKIREILLKKGYNIARRTVAKYRESLHIPVARMRKELEGLASR